MKLLKVAALSATLLAGGCAGDMSWQRADGRPLDRSSFAWAAAECRERARERGGYEDSATEVMQRCMLRRGYVWTAAPTDGYYCSGSRSYC